MPRIVLIAYDINPNIGSEAGVAFIWADILSDEYDVCVFTQEKHKLDLEKIHSKFEVKYINKDGVLSKLFLKFKLYNFDYLLFVRKLKTQIDENILNDASVLHFITPAGIHSYNQLGRQLRIPYIIGPVGGFLKLPQGFEEYKNYTMRLKEFFYSRLIKNKKWIKYFKEANQVIAGTELVAGHLPMDCANKIKIIHDAVVDTEFFNAERKRNGDNKIIITYSGRLEVFKGCQILIRAFVKVLERGYNNIELNFAGGGRELISLKKFVDDKQLHGRVKLLGRISKTELRNLLNDSDIFCLPTLKEPGGVAILEAMACGLPVITTNYGGPAYSVPKKCGILIEPVNIDDYILKLSDTLERLIKNKLLRLQLGQNARKHVIENYSASGLKNKIIGIYQNMDNIYVIRK